jgi:hypothetical protein
LVTAGTRQVVQRLGPARISARAKRAFTLTGPYGTGKSALALFLARLFADTDFPGGQDAQRLLREADPDLAKAVLRTADGQPVASLLPVAVTGSREPLWLAIVRGVEAAVPAIPTRRRAELRSRLARLRQQADARRVPSADEIVQLLGKTLAAACDRHSRFGGLFLIVDELGKLLEHAALDHAVSDVHLLQAIAESAARAAQPFLVLGVLHQDFTRYAERLSAKDRADWEKVRGRFEDINFEQPADDILRLIALARTQAQTLHHETGLGGLPRATRESFQALCDEAWKLGLGPTGMGKAELTDLLRTCWPLHPLVSLLLGRVFRKLAQNERSVFAFLQSAEPFGLQDFLGMDQRGPHEFYGAARLYDYLVSSIGEGLYSHWQGKRWAEIDTALTRRAAADARHVQLIKTIGLIGAMGEWKNLAATADVLEFAVQPQLRAAEVKTALRELKANSVVLFRKHSGSYALWEGSDVDLDAAVRAARNRVAPSASMADRLSRHVAIRPLVARRHSFETGCLRYFDVHLVSVTRAAEHFSASVGGSLRDAPCPVSERPDYTADPPTRPQITVSSNSAADGSVLIVVPETMDEERQAVALAKSATAAKRHDVLVGVAHASDRLAELIADLASLEWVGENTPQLAGDPSACR